MINGCLFEKRVCRGRTVITNAPRHPITFNGARARAVGNRYSAYRSIIGSSGPPRGVAPPQHQSYGVRGAGVPHNRLRRNRSRERRTDKFAVGAANKRRARDQNNPGEGSPRGRSHRGEQDRVRPHRQHQRSEPKVRSRHRPHHTPAEGNVAH